MFDTLIESKKKVNKGSAFGGGMVSTIVHALLITAAVFATLGAKEQLEESRADTNMVFVTPPEPEQPPEPEPPPPEQVLATLAPPPKGFQTVVPPSEIPTEIPDIDLSQTFDPRNFTGRGVEGGVAWGVEDSDETVDLNATFLEAVVQERPEPLSCPTPRYPDILRNARIEGRVLLKFVIDADGRAEPSSLEVVSSDNGAFNRPAEDAIKGCRFRPGRIRGQAVRVLVQMPVRFNLVG